MATSVIRPQMLLFCLKTQADAVISV